MTNLMTIYWAAWHHIKTTEAPQAIKLIKKDCRNEPWVLMEIHTKEFSLFNVYFVSAGQVQGLDTRRVNNEQVKNWPQMSK